MIALLMHKSALSRLRFHNSRTCFLVRGLTLFGVPALAGPRLEVTICQHTRLKAELQTTFREFYA